MLDEFLALKNLSLKNSELKLFHSKLKYHCNGTSLSIHRKYSRQSEIHIEDVQEKFQLLEQSSLLAITRNTWDRVKERLRSRMRSEYLFPSQETRENQCLQSLQQWLQKREHVSLQTALFGRLKHTSCLGIRETLFEFFYRITSASRDLILSLFSCCVISGESLTQRSSQLKVSIGITKHSCTSREARRNA